MRAMRWLGLAAVLVHPVASRAADTPPTLFDPSDNAAMVARLTANGCYEETAGETAAAPFDRALDACPDQRPMLRIETGVHIAVINRIGVDAACRIAATASDDKTVRLWALPEGRLLRTQRLPIGDGDKGKVYTAAVSPDGRLVAAGGWDAFKPSSDNGVYVFDAETGDTVRRFGGLGQVIHSLAFSPDGRRLAAGIADDGVRIFDVATGRRLASDTEYDGATYGMAFAADGTLYTVALDGYLRRYAPDGHRTAKVETPGGDQGNAVAVSPDGSRVAVAYDSESPLDIFDAATLRPVAATPARSGDSGGLSSVAWSADGLRLVAGGSERDDQGRRLLLSFDRDGRPVGRPVPVSDNTVSDLKTCGDGVAFSASDPAFGLAGATGAATRLARDHRADMRGKRGDALAVSQDGARVRFGLGYGDEDPVVFDLAAGTLAAAPTIAADLHAPDVRELPVAAWKNDQHPTLRGERLRLSEYETSRGLAILPDGTGFVLSTDYNLRRFDRHGASVWHADVPATAWGVNLARHGNLVVAACSDGTIRWHRGSDGAELLALFVDLPSRRFVAWTPSGYYLALPGAEGLIGWQINRGWTQQAEFITGDRLAARLARPDVVRAILDTGDEAAAVQRADAARTGGTEPAGVRPAGKAGNP